MTLYFATIFFLGLAIGSFLNAVIYRLKKEESLRGRSYCPHCKHVLVWSDLVPVFSFLFLGGKCRHCKAKISIQYPMVEISTALIFLLIYNLKFEIYNQFSIFQFLNLCFLFYIASVLMVVFVYDLKHYLILDKVLFPAIAIAFFYRLFENLSILALNSNAPAGSLPDQANSTFQISNFAPLLGYVAASFLASAFFLAIFLVSGGRWMGFGDVKLAILLGLLVGFPSILVVLFLAFLFGAIIGVGAILLSKKGLKSEMPFAPFLILGTFAALFWGNEIINWYLGFLT